MYVCICVFVLCVYAYVCICVYAYVCICVFVLCQIVVVLSTNNYHVGTQA